MVFPLPLKVDFGCQHGWVEGTGKAWVCVCKDVSEKTFMPVSDLSREDLP